jgi:hypothetical protein
MDPPHASRRHGGKAQALHWIVAGLIASKPVRKARLNNIAASTSCWTCSATCARDARDHMNGAHLVVNFEIENSSLESC